MFRRQCLLLLFASHAFLRAQLPLPDPARLGPYPVGVTTTVLIDHNRTDGFTNKPRTLVTEIWYPATEDARGLPKNRYIDFFPGGVTAEIDQILSKSYKRPAAEIDRGFWNHAVRDARVRPGRFPLIVFSHGNGGTRHQNTFWCDHLASHGYIIVSADHTGNARHTIIDGELIPYQPAQRAASAVDRVKDMSFLLDQMIRWDRGADSRFAGHLDTGRVAATGMSFGSFTAVRVVDADARFQAVIPMSGIGPNGHTNVTIPTLPMLGTEDRTLGLKGNDLIRAYHARHQGPAFLLELVNGGHYSFTDIFKINPNFGDGAGEGKRRDSDEPFRYTSMEDTYRIINSYSAAFCGVYLRGEKGYLPFLEKNHWPEILVWKPKGVPTSSGSWGSP